MADSYFELGKASLLQPTLAFGDVRVLLVEPEAAYAHLARKILFALGCTQVITTRSGEEALELLQSEQFDLAICSWDLPDMNGPEFSRRVRQGAGTMQAMLPLVLVSERSAVQDVLTARDSGINEYIIRPFTAKALIERLYMLAEQPRNFILSKIFIGPDRRRMNPVKQIIGQVESDTHVKRRPPLVVSRDALTQPINDDVARLILPDYSLKLKVGLHVPDELQRLSVASEKSLEAARQTLLIRLQHEITTLKHHSTALDEGGEMAQQAIRAITQSAQVIAQESMLIGYHYATEIAELLFGFCMHFARTDDAHHYLIITKHIEVLQVVFAQHLSEDGGYLGATMLADLSRLIKKYTV